jgi:hypothetical protein
MPKKKSASGSIQWTGKNLAEIKQLHKGVAHHPEKGTPHFRDWTQHPDNLHITTDEGHTVIAEIGDSIVRGADGRITVEKSKTPRAPRALRAVPPSPGRVINATAGDKPRQRPAEGGEG